jgi:hypothetical protein
LNVQSVFTKEFEAFLARTPAEQMKNVVFEFRQANIVEHFDEYQVARGVIKASTSIISVRALQRFTGGAVRKRCSKSASVRSSI